MRLRFTKGAGKRDTLCAIRDDGSSTWSALQSGFVTHDFMHYSVETTLGYASAFYGLLNQGYDIQDFGETDESAGRKPSLPAEASYAECMVQVLWQQRLNGDWPSPEALREMLALVWDQFQLPPPPPIAPEQLGQIRHIYEDLLQRWERIAPGDSFELEFALDPAMNGQREALDSVSRMHANFDDVCEELIENAITLDDMMVALQKARDDGE